MENKNSLDIRKWICCIISDSIKFASQFLIPLASSWDKTFQLVENLKLVESVETTTVSETSQVWPVLIKRALCGWLGWSGPAWPSLA